MKPSSPISPRTYNYSIYNMNVNSLDTQLEDEQRTEQGPTHVNLTINIHLNCYREHNFIFLK